jgi:hypothetical protein
MKTLGGVDVYIYIFLTSALVGGQVSSSDSFRFTTPQPEKEPPIPIV